MTLSRCINVLLPGALAALALVAAAPAAQAQLVLTPDTGYEPFEFGGVGSTSDPSPIVFTSGTNTVLTIVDAFLSGDRFRLFNQGTLVGETSVPVIGFRETEPDAAFANPAFSRGSFFFGPGSYSLTLEVTQSPFVGGGVAYARLDTAQVAAIPEPSEWATGGIIVATLGMGMVRARRRKATTKSA